MTIQTNTPPALFQAAKNSTTTWQNDLQLLFNHAKDRFPDVVWELVDDGAPSPKDPEEVWGHKAIVYARAPPSFQARYFSFRPPPPTSPVPYSSSPTGTLPNQSAVSLTLGVDYNAISRSPSPFRAPSPSPSTNGGGLLRLNTTINPALFSNELEYLYTGKGFGDAFEFLFDSSEAREEGEGGEDARIDKLRKDLVFMWRSRLYSDVRVSLTGNFSSSSHENTTAIFSSHRFILISRSPYFHNRLLKWSESSQKHRFINNDSSNPSEPLTLDLPSPPFTPASLHFTLGFIYTGTLIFSHRTFDLDTAFHIMRSATYLALDTLYDEIQARIVQEMMHGLCHAFLEFPEYEAITGGKWGTGGCKCRQCARRAPRVLEFSLSEDVKNANLERGARRALVGLFGEGWCNAEFARLPQKTRNSLLGGLAKRTTPLNVFPLLFAAHAAMRKLEATIEPWADVARDMVTAARKTIDEVLATQAEKCFEQDEWVSIMEADGARFEDAERVEWIMESVVRGISEKNAAALYQTLVSSILLRPHATEPSETMLSSTSHIRVQVEQARMDVIRWLRKRWIGVRQEGGFDTLDGWALKELSHELEVPIEEFFSPETPTPKTTPTRSGVRSMVSKVEETDSISAHSLRPSVLHRARHPETLKSSAASVRSVARSTLSTRSTVTSSPNRRFTAGPRPDSKLTPSSITTPVPGTISLSGDVSIKPRVSRPSVSRRPISNASTTTAGEHHPDIRPKSSAASVRSTRTTASTLRKSTPGAPGPSTLRPPSSVTPSSRPSSRPSSSLSRPPSSIARPTSTASATSDASTAFETAKSEVTPSSTSGATNLSVSNNNVRTRRLSSASTVSTASVRTTGTTPRTPRPRQPSTAASTKGAVKRPPSSPVDRNSLSPAAKRTASSTSVRSSTSTSPSIASRRTPVKRSPPALPPAPRLSKAASNATTSSAASTKSSAPSTVKRKKSAPALPSPTASTVSSMHEKQGSVVSSSSASTVKGSLKRKSSSDTITEFNSHHNHNNTPTTSTTVNEREQAAIPKGATLDIGIPCIISSKRARFKAYARYIGEVEGEAGPWVGVEVPMSDSWDDEKLDGRQWNDGTWGGIRYFEIGTTAEWDNDERMGSGLGGRRRRGDWSGSSHHYGTASQSSLKREGDQLSVERAKRLRSASPAVSEMSNSESRGLFVRPQQVLYVLDAVS